ncbi:MAG: ISL3 family transposase [Pseudomonadota bacterium]
MPEAWKTSRLLPSGLVVDDVTVGPDEVVIEAHARGGSAKCPCCGRLSRRVHSRYKRCLSDVPAHGRRVLVRLSVRRFRCAHGGCPRKIFAERLEIGITRPYARRTTRLQQLVRCLGVALGGRPGQGMARRLLFPVSKDTLLRSVRADANGGETVAPRVIGIDDWAWKKGHRYGTIICDLEQRRVIDILPDREAGTVEAWLAERRGIEIVSRDRGGGYGSAVTRALPGARQVADRWHLLENASRAFVDAVRKCLGDIRRALTKNEISPALLTAAERVQYEGFLRCAETNAAVHALAAGGVPIKAIVRQIGCIRQVVRRIVRGEREDIFRIRQSSLEPWLPQLDAEWTGGCRNGAELWRRLRAAGFRGSIRVVTEWATRRRRSESAPDGRPRKCPSARAITRMMTVRRDHLTREEALTVAQIEHAVPQLAEAATLIGEFQNMIRNRQPDLLDAWLRKAERGLISSFARGLATDRDAVAAAMKEPWSNGQTEGQINRLKTLKRQMYGRAKLDLLKARMIAA